jgi:outer membrane lipoprotein SlyB
LAGLSAKANSAASPTRAAEAPPLETQRAALCKSCGVVEGVRAVERKGEGSGVGAVAGGVVGAVVGNQMGGGSGKAAMTVLGAIGGGVAGNEIEKRHKATTVYDVRVRMDDGTLRSFTSATAPTPGAPVTVTDTGFKVVQRPAEGGARVVRTGG